MPPRTVRITLAGALMLAGLPLAAPLPAAAQTIAVSADIAAAVAASTRTPANMARDQYRHPAETLSFFGVKPTDTVVEIWPGGGWYTEILTPYLKGKGTLWAVDFWPDSLKGIQNLQAKDAALYGGIKLAAFPASAGQPTVPAGSADMVLTFRNVHNFQMGYKREGKDYGLEAFQQMFAMLKPGGVLGIVDHRLPEADDAAREKTSGYVKVSTVRKLAEQAGFVFEGASEINANPRDTTKWTKGVWTLPPRYAEGDVDRAKYQAIGESDRMTLKFRKPQS
jgi:predicted methyltransferase